MCKPHKALRMTIKVHLKTEEKKRAAAAAAALAAKSASPAVLQAEETPAPAAAVSLEPQHQQQPRETSTTVDTNYQTTEDGPAGPGATDPLAQVDEVCCALSVLLQSSVVALLTPAFPGLTRSSSRSQRRGSVSIRAYRTSQPDSWFWRGLGHADHRG